MARFQFPIEQLVNDDASGVASGWKVSFYASGTTTRKDTFSDASLSTANTNPVVANSAGRFGDIFYESGTYKVVLTDENDVEKWTADPVEGAIGASGAVDEITSAYTVTIDDATKILAVNATSAAVTITLLSAVTAGDGFEVTVKKTDSSVNAVTIDGNGAETIDGDTTFLLTAKDQTVTTRSDGANWQVTSSYAVAAGIVKWAKGADIASPAGGALTLGTDGNYFDITGTNAITSIGTVGVGTVVKLHFDAALTLTHHATDLVLPNAEDVVTVAGDEFEFIEYASGDWRCTHQPQRIASATFKGVVEKATQAEMEAETADKYPDASLIKNSPGVAKAWASVDRSAGTPTLDSPSYNITSVTDVSAGVTAIVIGDDFSTAVYVPVAQAVEDTPRFTGVTQIVVGSFRVEVINEGASAQDTQDFVVVAHGDQA
jgi:hypothetical protein